MVLATYPNHPFHHLSFLLHLPFRLLKAQEPMWPPPLHLRLPLSSLHAAPRLRLRPLQLPVGVHERLCVLKMPSPR